MSRSVVSADHHFAMVPEWVLYADIGANAVRLYAVLRRFADQQSNACWPSRRLLAERCKFSPATVDRALEELVALGAVRVTARANERGDRTSNLYTLLSVPNSSPVDVGGSPTNHPLCTGDETPLLTGDEGTIAISNESQENHMATANAIASGWWDRQQDKPITPFLGLRSIVLSALKAGYAPERVEQALARFNTVPSKQQLELAMKNVKAVAQPVAEEITPGLRRALEAAANYRKGQA